MPYKLFLCRSEINYVFLNFKLFWFTYADSLSESSFFAGYRLRYAREDHSFCDHYLIDVARTAYHPEAGVEDHEQSQESLFMETNHVVRGPDHSDYPDRDGLG